VERPGDPLGGAVCGGGGEGSGGGGSGGVGEPRASELGDRRKMSCLEGRQASGVASSPSSAIAAVPLLPAALSLPCLYGSVRLAAAAFSAATMTAAVVLTRATGGCARAGGEGGSGGRCAIEVGRPLAKTAGGAVQRTLHFAAGRMDEREGEAELDGEDTLGGDELTMVGGGGVNDGGECWGRVMLPA